MLSSPFGLACRGLVAAAGLAGAAVAAGFLRMSPAHAADGPDANEPAANEPDDGGPNDGGPEASEPDDGRPNEGGPDEGGPDASEPNDGGSGASGSGAGGPGRYEPTWSSVGRHPAAPQWFQDAKFGIYFHWGAFSVPAFGNEWYPRNMYFAESAENNHHRSVYGDPSVWPYHNFITGARDRAGNWVQFAPKLKSAGGHFDPHEWAQLFVDAGAKFAGPVAEHHDGYSMWNSKVNEWNSVATGPGLNLLELHADAIRAKGLKLLIAMHHAYNFTGFYEEAPAQPTDHLRKLYGQLGATAENQLWQDKLREVVDGYRPDILWQDFKLDAVDETARLDFLAHYFNQAAAWRKDVVTTYKDGFDNRGSVFDFERGGPAGLHWPYWLTDDSISSSSWCYTVGIGYYTLAALLHSLIDRVSKNGTVLLNVAPEADGRIPADQQKLLRGIGDYLRHAGESIYGTRAWTTYGEGPTQMGGGAFTEPREGTNRDIRFTRHKNNQILYATVLGWPGSSLTITTLNANRINLGTLRSAGLLGHHGRGCADLEWTQDGGGLHLRLPDQPTAAAPAYVVKLTFAGPIPALGGGSVPTSRVRLANVTTGLVLDSGGSVAEGSILKQGVDDGSPNLQWQLIAGPDGFYRLVNHTNGLVADSGGQTTNESSAIQAPWNGSENQQWWLNHMGDGRYQIVNRATGMALDGGGNSTEGARVKLCQPDSSTNLQWTFTSA